MLKTDVVWNHLRCRQIWLIEQGCAINGSSVGNRKQTQIMGKAGEEEEEEEEVFITKIHCNQRM